MHASLPNVFLTRFAQCKYIAMDLYAGLVSWGGILKLNWRESPARMRVLTLRRFDGEVNGTLVF